MVIKIKSSDGRFELQFQRCNIKLSLTKCPFDCIIKRKVYLSPLIKSYHDHSISTVLGTTIKTLIELLPITAPPPPPLYLLTRCTFGRNLLWRIYVYSVYGSCCCCWRTTMRYDFLCNFGAPVNLQFSVRFKYITIYDNFRMFPKRFMNTLWGNWIFGILPICTASCADDDLPTDSYKSP